jgi:hypothetical protein
MDDTNILEGLQIPIEQYNINIDDNYEEEEEEEKPFKGGVSDKINSYIEHLERKHRFLKGYQKIIQDYVFSSLFKTKQMLLCWLAVGRGKTMTSLACGITGIDHGTFDRIIILSPKSIQNEFEQNLMLYLILDTEIKTKTKTKKAQNKKLLAERYNYYMKKIIMIPYNAWNAYQQFKKIKHLEHSLFIIDEAHIFGKAIIKTNLTEKEAKLSIKTNKQYKTQQINQNSLGLGQTGNAYKIYIKIKETKDKKVLALTGTPASKLPYELVPLFNLAYNYKKIIPEDKEEFEQKFINKEKYRILNKDILLKRLDGLTVYVPNLAQIKSTNLIEVNVEMSHNQYLQYLIDYQSELDEQGSGHKKNMFGFNFGGISSYHAKTFEDCIYWNEDLHFTSSPSNRYKGKTNMIDHIDKAHCPKIIKMYDDAITNRGGKSGICCFYFKFVHMFGVEAMELKLQKEGYHLPDQEQVNNKNDKVADAVKKFYNQSKPAKRYVIFTGDISMKLRNIYKALLNDQRNKHGEYIKFIILSPSGMVGISLKNVRFLGIGSVDFSISNIRQIECRVERFNSHIDLEPKHRTLTKKIYIMTKNKNYYNSHKEVVDEICSRKAPFYSEKAPSIERIIYQDAIKDDIINEKFRKILIKSSITEKIYRYF